MLSRIIIPLAVLTDAMMRPGPVRESFAAVRGTTGSIARHRRTVWDIRTGGRFITWDSA